MLIPMPSLPSPHSFGPSEYAKGRVVHMLAVLIIQTIFCTLRMVMLLDIMGGFIMAIGVGLGWYAWKEDMHITYTCYWGLMSFFNGVMDLVKLIDHAVKSPLPLFSTQLGMTYGVQSLTLMMVPCSLLMGAALAYYMYKHHDDMDVVSERFGYGSARAPPPPSYTPFAGSGQRLGNV
eukprot:TRINITY_DN5046_c0_g2_i2.p1 TRINITY_DN5046_c0_g2~~TRINITY_DN5046_c0_g2_i2.p1  ORF type:complete len:177 (+),score=24.13 TRINITY_DN5046_c0_g2_i2:102-632(+)